MLKGSSFLSAVEDWTFPPPLLESIDRISIGIPTGRVAPSGWADFIVVFRAGSKTIGSSVSRLSGSIPVFRNADEIVLGLNARSQA